MRLFPIRSSSKVLLLDCCQTQKTQNCQTQGKTGTISLWFLLHYTGYQSGIGLVLKSYKLLSKPLMALHHPTLKTSSHLMSPVTPLRSPDTCCCCLPCFTRWLGFLSLWLRNLTLTPSSGTPYLKIFGQHFLKPTFTGCPSWSKPLFSASHLLLKYPVFITLFLSGILLSFFYCFTFHPVIPWLLLPDGLHNR